MSDQKYAYVHFGPNESEGLRKFYHGMNGLDIITISQEELNRDIEEFQKMRVGVDNRLVLHNAQEVQSFELFMKAFMPEKKYEITNTPEDKEFENWLEHKNRIDYTIDI